MIVRILKALAIDETTLEAEIVSVQKEVKEMCDAFPIYSNGLGDK